MLVLCNYCGRAAKLVGGDAIYPRIPHLHSLNFWQCKPCQAYVGCHRPSKKHNFTGIEPFGTLAKLDLRLARKAAHLAFDPIWKTGLKLSRKHAYAWLARELGISSKDCHIARFDMAQATKAIQICKSYMEKNHVQ
jgi:hypothetical protein